jgi:endonuclease III
MKFKRIIENKIQTILKINLNEIENIIHQMKLKTKLKPNWKQIQTKLNTKFNWNWKQNSNEIGNKIQMLLLKPKFKPNWK